MNALRMALDQEESRSRRLREWSEASMHAFPCPCCVDCSVKFTKALLVTLHPLHKGDVVVLDTSCTDDFVTCSKALCYPLDSLRECGIVILNLFCVGTMLKFTASFHFSTVHLHVFVKLTMV